VDRPRRSLDGQTIGRRPSEWAIVDAASEERTSMSDKVEFVRVRLPWNGGFFGSYDPSQWRDGVGQRRVRVAPGMVAIQILAQMHMPVGIEVAAGA